MVRVWCPTFNHASYIIDALNGFSIQKTDFPCLYTIFDDASTDGEQEIIRNYLHEHFNIQDPSTAMNEETDDYILTVAQHKTNPNCFFAVFLLKYNHYSIRKSQNGYIEGRFDNSKYFCICEGDDYWTDPLKLQKQVDYMEAHPECGLVYTQAKQYIQETGEFIDGWAAQTDFEDLLLNANKIMTLTICLRCEVCSNYSDEIGSHPNWRLGDLPLWLFISKHSKIHFFDDNTGVYRILKHSASHTQDLEKMLSFMSSVYDVRCFFANRYGCQHLIRPFTQTIINDFFRLSVQKDKNFSKYIFRFAKRNKSLSLKNVFKCLLYSSKIGRHYHKKKFPNSSTMY